MALNLFVYSYGLYPSVSCQHFFHLPLRRFSMCSPRAVFPRGWRLQFYFACVAYLGPLPHFLHPRCGPPPRSAGFLYLSSVLHSRFFSHPVVLTFRTQVTQKHTRPITLRSAVRSRRSASTLLTGSTDLRPNGLSSLASPALEGRIRLTAKVQR